jgi:hypothetical protein
MTFKFPEEQGDFEQNQHIETKGNACIENKSANELSCTEERNLGAKASMVTELVDMGLSLETIERILHLDPEVLDRLL